jgi:type IV pilus assembly protein PilN
LDASQWLSSSNLNIISTEKDAKEATDTILLRDFKLDVTQLLRQGQEAEEAATTGKPNKAPTPNKKPEAGK